MIFQSLNEDTLAFIASYLDFRDARNLSLCCRAVHVVAKNQALTSVTVHSPENTMKFCQYILSELTHRLPALRELIIEDGGAWSLWEQRTEAAPFLAEVLSGACNLRRLALDNSEIWFREDRRIANTISSMRLLSDLNLGGFGCFRRLSPTCRPRVFPATPDSRWHYLELTLENCAYSRLRLDSWIDMGSIHFVNITAPLAGDLTPAGRDRDGRGNRACRDRAVEVVQDVDPVALRASIARGPEEAFVRQLSTSSPRLRYLHIDLTYLPDTWRRITAWWDHFSRVITATEIICFRVTMGCRQYDVPGEHPPSLDYFAPTAATFSSAAKSVTTMRYLCFTIALEWSNSCALGVTIRRAFTKSREDGQQRDPDRSYDDSGSSPLPSLSRSPSSSPSPARDPTRSRSPSPSLNPSTPLSLTYAYWWRVRGGPGGRHAQPIDVATGERVAAYLCSPRYDPAGHFDESELDEDDEGLCQWQSRT